MLAMESKMCQKSCWTCSCTLLFASVSPNVSGQIPKPEDLVGKVIKIQRCEHVVNLNFFLLFSFSSARAEAAYLTQVRSV